MDTRADLTELVVRSGLKVLEVMLEEDRVGICGPRYVHRPSATRFVPEPRRPGWCFGGRKIGIRRPHVRAGKKEVALPTFQAMTATDPLNRRVVEQMLVGGATRQYARSLDPLPAGVRTRGPSKRRNGVNGDVTESAPGGRRPSAGVGGR